MQQTQLDPRSRVGGSIQRQQLGGAPSYPALIDFQREHVEFLRRAAMSGAGPSFTVTDMGSVASKSQDFEVEARAARLAVENDQLRVDRALLLSQLAAKDVEIRDLRSRLSSDEGENEIEALPHRRLAGAISGRSRLGTVRRGAPFIHPDDLIAEDE